MTSRSIRPRPIDFSKPMPVVQSQKELEVDEDGVLRPRRDLGADGLDEGGMEDEGDLETLRILQEQYEKDTKKVNIPVPPIIVIEDYDKHVAKDYVRPNSYLRFKQLSDKELDEMVEYEMDDQDLVYVNVTLKDLKMQIKEDKFEHIVDRLEKESYKLGKMCEQTVLEQFKLGGKIGSAVYEHWRKKREKLGKPLIRRFQPPTSSTDMSPHSTFRPREKEEKRIRRTRKNDKDAHKKLKNLQADFRRAKELLEHVVRREKMKKVLLELDFCLQFAKDIRDIPAQILMQHDTFFKELREQQRATKQGKEAGEAQALGANRPRPPARPAAILGSEEEALFKAEEQHAPEKLEGIRRCFQHLMIGWDEDADDAGTSVLPITRDARLVAVGTPSSGDGLRFRGRARVGRGGRVVFDRCSYRVAGLHAGDSGGMSAGKRSRDGGGGGGNVVGSVWEDLKDHAKQHGAKHGKAGASWGLGGLHSKVGAVQAKAQMGGLQSLGQISSLWAKGGGEPPKGGLVRVREFNINGGRPPAKKAKVGGGGGGSAASHASTVGGGD